MSKKAILFLLATSTLTGAIGWSNRSQEHKATVYLVLSTDCPVAMQYTGRINRLVAEYGQKGIDFQALFPNDLESKSGVDRYMSERDYKFPAELDLGAAKSKALGVTHVPTAIVVQSTGKVVYLGGIDDSKDPTLVKNAYLQEALAAVSVGTAPKVRSTKAVGCVLMPGAAAPKIEAVNYAEHVAKIVNDHCVECHRPGEVAPFSLIGYENAKKWAPMIAQVSKSRSMPPWKAVHGFGEFQDENRLEEAEIETIQRWSEAGTPKGELSKAPPAREFASDWTLGKPDMVMTASREFKLAAEGADEYRNFVVHTNDTKENMWVTAMDVRPGNRQIVHHVIAFIDGGKSALRKESQATDGNPGYKTFGGPGFIPITSLGGWAPGLRPRHTQDMGAFRVPPGASVVMQVHYHRTGKPETDQTKLGIYLAKQKPQKEVRLAWLANPMFRIPAGAKNHKVTLNYRAPANITVYGAMPHMHLLGQSMKAEVQYADGTKKPLIWVDKWDFNWQIAYVLKQPLKLPAGARILVEGYYDNSTDNPFQPRKEPQDITWGEETTDEMFLLVVPYTLDAENLG